MDGKFTSENMEAFITSLNQIRMTLSSKETKSL